ncbi:MAG TPA: DUF3617 family protein [Allosphingosinicella sp.]|jgi:hypothetical protein
MRFSRLPACALLLVIAADGCGGAPPDDVHAQKAGLWEVRVSAPKEELAALPPKERAQVEAMLNPPEAGRQCFRGAVPTVGQKTLEGRCAFSRVADKGARVERTMSCKSVRPGTLDVIETTGTRSAERYDFRIVSRRIDAATGRTITQARTREQGRRLGPCPDEPRS